MKYTMYNTPVLKTILRIISLAMLKVTGWEYVGVKPTVPKYVAIAAPHTSNWDMPVMFYIAFAFKLKIYWTGKKELFKKPFGTIMKFMGGIPIDRSKSTNIVEASIQLFNKTDEIVMIVPPEGTRSKVNYWKTGFYYIAYGAKVPIALAFMDWSKKKGGFGPLFTPTGDLEKDMAYIKNYYKDIKGKKHHQTGEANIHETKKVKDA